MTRTSSLTALLLAVSASGCLLDRAGRLDEMDPEPLADGAPAPRDAASVVGADAAARGDASAPRDADSGFDAAAPRVDAGATTLDAGPECSSEDERCDREPAGTELAVTCEAGSLNTVDCAAVGQRCVDDGDGPRCEAAPTCSPGETKCTTDGSAVLRCRSDGTWSEPEACAEGCVDGACRIADPCPAPLAGTIEAGTMDLDLCGGDDERHLPWGDCSSADPAGQEVLVRLDVPSVGQYVITLEDAGPDGRSVDPMLYLRSTCDEPLSQRACDDDGGSDLGARIETWLEAGSFYLVAEGLEYPRDESDAQCGAAVLRVRRL